MRHTKSIALIIIILVFAVTCVSKAQKDPTTTVKQYKSTSEEQAKKITDKMKTHLNLTDEQYNKILKLQTDRIAYKRELRGKDLISKSEVKMKRQEFRDGIKNTLTDDQMKKVEKMMKKKHHKQKRHRR
jgi:hypothetical protein